MLADSYYCSYFLIAAGGQAKAQTFPAIADHSPKSAQEHPVIRTSSEASRLTLPFRSQMSFRSKMLRPSDSARSSQ
jgi:hypothetical protein